MKAFRVVVDGKAMGDLGVADFSVASVIVDLGRPSKWETIDYHFRVGGLIGIATAGFKLRVTIDSLIKGEHIECKSLGELVGAENAMVESCKNVSGFLELAATFDGREEVLEL